MIKRFITYYLPLLLGAFLQATICFADECEVTYKAYTGRWDASHAFSFVTESDAYFSKGLFPEYGLPRPAFQFQQYTLQSGYDGSAGGVRFSYVVPEDNPYLVIHYAISGHIGYGGHEPMYDCIRVLSKDGIVGCPFEFVSGENISAEISKGYIVNTTSSVFFDGYFPWRNLIYNLSNYVGQTVTIEGIAACCDNVKCRTTLYMAFENFGPQELCTNCGVTKISIPDGMSSYIWHKGSPDGPIVSREQEIYVDWKHIDDYYCTLYPPYCNGTPFLMTKRIKSVASFDYRVACGEEKDTLYLTNKSYMYYEDNPSKHIPCDTVLWDFGNGYSTSEFTPNPITFDHNGIYEISLQVGNKDFVCDSTQYVTFETGNVSHNDKVDTICDSQLPYEWRGKQYMSSGDYYDTLTNRWGCDSLLHLSLVVHPTTYSYSAFTIKKGESVSWQGDTYTDAGTYTKILKNVYGCDSILTLTLTLLEPVSSDTYLTLCPGHIPYVWNGVLCLGAGEYSAVLKTAFGQDSIARLHLSVGSPARSDTSAVICLSDFPFEWHGQKINKGGIYTDIMPSIAGCDSVVTFIITEKDCSQIEPTDHPLDPMPFLPIRDTLDTTICIGDTLMWHGIAYAHDTTARDTGYYSWYPLDSVYWVLELKTEVCCDTTYSTTDTIFLYDSLKLHPFMWFEKEYVEPGVYNDTLKGGNYMSCDSIGSLLLRVIYKDSLYACGDEQVTFHTPWGDYDSKPDCECLNGYLLQTSDGEWLVDATLCVNRIMADTTRELRTISQGDSLVFVDTVLYTSGIYSKSFLNKYGCDSTHIIELIVIPYPDNVDTINCVVPPMASDFEMKELFRCEGANDMTTPLVADLDGDGITEIIATASSLSGAYTYTCDKLLVYSGENGMLLNTFPVTTFSLSGQPIAIADVDKDSKCEIFVVGTNHILYCYNYLGIQKWQSSNTMDNPYIPMLADVNNDNIPEVVCDKYVYNAISGNLLLEIDLLETGMGFGAPNGINEPKHYYPYYLPALADVDGNGTLELCAGNSIYKMNITSENISQNSWSLLRKADIITQYSNYNYDGQTIVLDFDGDGDFDICVLGSSHTTTDNSKPYLLDTYVWDGQTEQIISFSRDTAKKWYADTWSTVSIPFAGDINNDGLPEIMYNIPGVGMCAFEYDNSTSNKMRQVHKHQPWKETSGFTVFDFNMDGNNEIVARTSNTLYIADGITLNNLCSPISALSQTMTEYPIVADVNGDGVAEIVVACTNDHANRDGWISVYGPVQPGTWSSARPVWNQWAYNSVNINDDMTVPQYQYDVATQFPNGTKPFNSFLAQKPIIDKQGDIFVPAADVNATAASYEVKNDSIEISVSYCNTGDANLIAPYEITVYQNEYRGTILQIDTITESLNIDSCKEVTLKVPALSVCQIARDTAFIIAINDDGHGIAQHGNQQAECDTTNNQARIVLKNAELLRDTTVEIISICDSDLPYTHSTTGIVFPIGTSGNVDTCKLMISKQGCDSVVRLQLTVISTSTEDTTAYVCYGDLPYLWHGKSLTESCDTSWTTINSAGCDSVVKLHLFVSPEPKNEHADTTICYGDRIDWHGQTINAEGTFYDTARVTMGNGQLCDSIWYELAVTIQKSDTTTNNISICTGGQYTWKRNGKPDSVIREAGEYWDTVRYVRTDCDSMIYHLTLQVEDINRDSVSAETCANTPYLWRGQSLTAEGIYRDTAKAKTVTECDTIYTLKLIIKAHSTGDTTAYVCYGDLPYLWHGKSLTESCDTSWTTTNSVGCDSVVTLHLFVGPEPKSEHADTTICYGDMIDWHGQPISVEGTFYDTARVTMGNGLRCDSIWYELAVTIQKSDTTTNNISICTGGQYTWKRNGKPDSVIREAGEYWDTVRYVRTDCDSMIYHLTLQVEDINRDSVSAETCANTPYLWRGQSLTAEGIYRDTAKAKTVTECDTVYTLRLTINQPTIGDTIVMACDSFTWHGVTYTESTDTATWTTTNIAGCDSIVTLHLTIHHASSSETNISICSEELPYTWNGKNYTAEGDYTYRTINAAGCDSTATLHLKVIQCCPDTIMRRQELTICDTLMPYTWVTWREVVVEETGSFADTLRNDVGCDSIIYTLTLDTFHCCAPLMAAIDVPDYICADAPYLPIEVKLLSGECASYSLHFTNPALNKMPFRDTTITIDVQYASDEPFILDIPVPDDPDDSTHYVRPDDNYKVSLTLHDRCENSIIFGDSIFSVYYPSWVTDQHWDDVIALLNDRYNGGYTFSSVQWLRDGEELAGEDGLYIYLPHELWTNPSHQYQSYFYQALLTRTDDGKTLPTCPLEPWHIDNTNVLSDSYVSVTPTLVPKENPVVHVMTNTEGTYWIYDPAGKLLQTADYEPCEHSAFDIRLYCVQTMYILVFTSKNEKNPLQHKYSVVKVLVE